MSINIKQQLIRNLSNIPGWHTNRKIVVIESDDWGSIRMSSRDSYERLLQKGFRINENSFNKYDALASEEDLTLLFEVLLSVRDWKNNPAIITANTVVANPDFQRIKDSGFVEYHFEPFTETLSHYPSHSKSFEIWKQGIASHIFKPQFHGREHLNVNKWMSALLENNGIAQTAFDYCIYDLSSSISKTNDSFLEALNFESEKELDFQKEIISEGLQLFNNIFGYQSTTFIAPCYIWSPRLNDTLKKNGVVGLQGSWYQLSPYSAYNQRFKKIFHYTGQKNSLGQYYLTRNAHFEPSYNPKIDWVSDCLKRIEIAFRWKKPAIISSHRVNFIGFIDPTNRDRNLKLLEILLLEIKTKWPEVEFMSSDELCATISEN